NRNGKRSRQHSRICIRGDVWESLAFRVEGEELHDGGILADKLPGAAKPRFRVVVGGIDDQRVALPVAARIAVPQLEVPGKMRLAVEVDHPVPGVEKKNDVPRELADFVAVP